MTWVKVVDGEVVETRSKAPTMERRLSDQAWQQLIPEQSEMFELCGWFEVERTSAPDDGFAYSGAWVVAGGRPVWQWTKGDALPEPPTPIAVDELPPDEVAGSIALLTQDAIEAKAAVAVFTQILESLAVPEGTIQAGLSQATAVAVERLKRYEDPEFRREQIAGRIQQAKDAP